MLLFKFLLNWRGWWCWWRAGPNSGGHTSLSSPAKWPLSFMIMTFLCWKKITKIAQALGRQCLSFEKKAKLRLLRSWKMAVLLPVCRRLRPNIVSQMIQVSSVPSGFDITIRVIGYLQVQAFLLLDRWRGWPCLDYQTSCSFLNVGVAEDGTALGSVLKIYRVLADNLPFLCFLGQ